LGNNGDDGFPNLGKTGVSEKPNATNNDNRTRNKHQDALMSLDISVPPTRRAKRNAVSVFVSENYQNQYKGQPARNHTKFPEFAAWCRNQGGQPTESGFWKWLCGQKPQWRNRVKTTDEPGYVLNGKFFTTEQANHMAINDPELLTKFRLAVKRDGRIQTVKRQ
jgi:hypothetical protein